MMNAKLIRRLLAAVALGLCAPASWSQASLTRVEGRVTDGGKPLTRAQVILSNPEARRGYSAITDTNGTFSLPEVAPGTYIISILNVEGENLFHKTLQVTGAAHAPIRINIDISGAAAGASAAPPASPPPAAQGSNPPAAGGPGGCTVSLILPMGTYSRGPAMGPYSPGGGAAAPYSAVEEFWVLEVLNDLTVASSKRQFTTKIYQDSHGRRRMERPICSQLYEDAEAVLVSIDDPVAGYEYNLDPQNRIAYRYSLRALKDSVPAANGNQSGRHMEVTKAPLGSQWMEGLLVVGTKETRRLIPPPAPYMEDLKTKEGIDAARARLEVTKAEIEEKRKALEASHSAGLTSEEDYSRQRRELEDRMNKAMAESFRIGYAESHASNARNDKPFTIVEEVWYSSEIGAVVLDKFIYEGVERRLTNIDRREPDISLFQPPADYKIEDATGPVTITYTNLEVPLAGHTQARPEATGKPQNKTAPAPPPGEVRENSTDGLKYVWIPPGTFTMGCSPGDSECVDWEKPSHQVTITKGFWIGQTPVTVGAYKRFASATGQQMPDFPRFNPNWANENMPIVLVSWNDSHAYCQWAGGRLPMEAEWEYAARGGSTDARYGPIDEVAWYGNNSGGRTHNVAEKRSNGFGLYDTLGNVWEWVNDWYDANYYHSSPSSDPPGPGSGQVRVVRGGSWGNYARHVRVSGRGLVDPAGRGYDDGLRCVGEANIP